MAAGTGKAIRESVTIPNREMGTAPPIATARITMLGNVGLSIVGGKKPGVGAGNTIAGSSVTTGVTGTVITSVGVRAMATNRKRAVSFAMAGQL
jgi:hypothetical protein